MSERRRAKIGDKVVVGGKYESKILAVACDSHGDVHYVKVRQSRGYPFFDVEVWKYVGDVAFIEACE